MAKDFEDGLYGFARFTLGKFLKTKKMRLDKIPSMGENYIVLANHTNFYDPLIVLSACRDKAYFVVGENLYRTYLLGKWEKYIHPIIINQGGGVPYKAIKDIIRRTRKGDNLVLFPEGSYTLNNETMRISPAISKLVKKAGCALVTYRISGGSMQYPYWCKEERIGPVRGKLSGVYSSRELSRMSDEELYKIILDDLYFDAEAYQNEHHYKYKCRRFAEGLENVLSICPKCGHYETIVTHDATIQCKHCGMNGSIDEYYELHGLPYKSIFEWQRWQEEILYRDFRENNINLRYDDVKLFTINKTTHKTNPLAEGTVVVETKRMSLGKLGIDFKDIRSCAVIHDTVLFSDKNYYYGLKGDELSAWIINRLVKLNAENEE